jgi:hypothetical protein
MMTRKDSLIKIILTKIKSKKYNNVICSFYPIKELKNVNKIKAIAKTDFL